MASNICRNTQKPHVLTLLIKQNTLSVGSCQKMIHNCDECLIHSPGYNKLHFSIKLQYFRYFFCGHGLSLFGVVSARIIWKHFVFIFGDLHTMGLRLFGGVSSIFDMLFATSYCLMESKVMSLLKVK